MSVTENERHWVNNFPDDVEPWIDGDSKVLRRYPLLKLRNLGGLFSIRFPDPKYGFQKGVPLAISGWRKIAHKMRDIEWVSVPEPSVFLADPKHRVSRREMGPNYDEHLVFGLVIFKTSKIRLLGWHEFVIWQTLVFRVPASRVSQICEFFFFLNVELAYTENMTKCPEKRPDKNVPKNVPIVGTFQKVPK